MQRPAAESAAESTEVPATGTMHNMPFMRPDAGVYRLGRLNFTASKVGYDNCSLGHRCMVYQPDVLQ